MQARMTRSPTTIDDDGGGDDDDDDGDDDDDDDAIALLTLAAVATIGQALHKQSCCAVF